MKKKILLLASMAMLLTGCQEKVITVAGLQSEDGQETTYIEMKEFQIKEPQTDSGREEVSCCAVLIPTGYYESEEIPGMYIHERSPLDSSNIYYTVSEGSGEGRVSDALTEESYQELVEEAYQESGQEASVEIDVPVSVAVHSHRDYINEIGLAMGVFTMLTTDAGHRYGEQFGVYQTEYADWIRERQISYRRNREANPGRKKYEAQKKRYEERLHSYINQELNRFFQTEKPRTVYLVKLPHGQPGGINKKINNSVTLWQRGYIRERLRQKCREQSVEFAEVIGKDISRECSCCGAMGRKTDGSFICSACGYRTEEKVNTARNVRKRGQTGQIVHGPAGRR